MKRIVLATATGLALALGPAPAFAQDMQTHAASVDLEQVMGAMSQAFPKEPLTAEEQARLPQAERIVALIVPEGAMGDIMGKMIDDILQPMMAMAGSGANVVVARGIGVTPFELDMTEEQAAATAELFDPAWAERQKREMEVVPTMMRDMMTLMEPSMRKAMSEGYAVRFTVPELSEIEAFFNTETGGKYARESFAMAADPRRMAASMEALPAMMQAMGDMEARMAESVADLPQQRSFAELSEEERDAVAAATGFTEAEILAALDSADSWAEDFEAVEEAVGTTTEPMKEAAEELDPAE